jgi:hypothetical protein
MKEKQTIAIIMIVGLTLLGVGYLLGLSDPSNVCIRKHQNFIDDGSIVIIPVDTIENRKTYNVLFSDEEGIDSMYPEEIANGLNTGRWSYNEMLTIKEEQ